MGSWRKLNQNDLAAALPEISQKESETSTKVRRSIGSLHQCQESSHVFHGLINTIDLILKWVFPSPRFLVDAEVSE